MRAYEAVRFANIFGYKCLELGLGKYVLKKRVDGRCVFQVYSNGRWICSIQSIKPLACKLWPFLISEKPHDSKEEAEYEFRDHIFYVYVNPFCRGLAYGKPTYIFAYNVIPEFIELSLGLRREQSLSTSLLVAFKGVKHHAPQYWNFSPNLFVSPQSLLAHNQNQTRMWCLQL